MKRKETTAPTNLMRLRERLAAASREMGDAPQTVVKDPGEELELLNDLCVRTKGTPAYPMAQARALLCMKEMETR